MYRRLKRSLIIWTTSSFVVIICIVKKEIREYKCVPEDSWPYLNENGRNCEEKGSNPNKGQNHFGLSDCATRFSLHAINDGVAPTKKGKKINWIFLLENFLLKIEEKYDCMHFCKSQTESNFSMLMMYSLPVRYLFLLGSQNVDFLAVWAEITSQSKSKQITFRRGDFMYHRFP